MENLYLYEKVLLILGVILFVILSGGLAYYIVKKQEIKKLFLFFMLPIVMIAYPSIQEFIIEDGIVKIKKYKNEVQNNPDDSEAKRQLEKVLLKLEPRAQSNEEISLEVSEAYILLDQPDKAIEMTNKILDDETRKNKEAISAINKTALIQKEILENPKDTLMIKNKINKIEPNKKAYFKRKYLSSERAH